MTNFNHVWGELSPEDHEFQYNPQKSFPNFADVRARLAPLNDEARSRLGSPREAAYGPHDLHRLDIFEAEGDGPRPVHVFYHGGYWRAQDKANFAFIAGLLVPLGITTVIVNYELCPSSTLDEVTASAIASFAWIAEHCAEFDGDPARITLSGHSAGAHLGAAIISDHGLASKGAKLAGALLTSGIFDPRPAMSTSVNEALQLTDKIAKNNDVERTSPQQMPQVCLLVGARETPHWVDQSFRYYHTLRRHGMTPELHLLPGHDHFDILEDYLRPAGMTLSVILRHCGVTAP